MKDLKKILIVDDEKDLCLLLKNYLTHKDYTVSVAHKLNDGIEKAKTFFPNYILLDHNLPDGYGWEKAEWFLDNFPSLKIILISAFQSKDTPLAQNKRVVVLEKPLSLQSLGKLISSD